MEPLALYLQHKSSEANLGMQAKKSLSHLYLILIWILKNLLLKYILYNIKERKTQSDDSRSFRERGKYIVHFSVWTIFTQAGYTFWRNVPSDIKCVLFSSLSYCSVTESGCTDLASALILNPLHLKELELTGNQLRISGREKLTVLQQHKDYKLEKLKWVVPFLSTHKIALIICNMCRSRKDFLFMEFFVSSWLYTFLNTSKYLGMTLVKLDLYECATLLSVLLTFFILMQVKHDTFMLHSLISTASPVNLFCNPESEITLQINYTLVSSLFAPDKQSSEQKSHAHHIILWLLMVLL